jgi:hypothetical protein
LVLLAPQSNREFTERRPQAATSRFVISADDGGFSPSPMDVEVIALDRAAAAARRGAEERREPDAPSASARARSLASYGETPR